MSKVTKIKTFDDFVEEDDVEVDTTGAALLQLAQAIAALAARPEPVFPKTDLTPLLELVKTLTPKPVKKKKWEFDVQRNTITGDIAKIVAIEI